MCYDFDDLEVAAQDHINSGNATAALQIYYYMSFGDPSLDAGYLAFRISECYQQLRNTPAARYWLDKAIQQNPELYKDEIGLLVPTDSELDGVLHPIQGFHQ